MAQAAFWEPIGEGKVRCRLCPHRCTLTRGGTGLCRARHNLDGELNLPLYGRISALALDPIEKKPLYHFLPGTEVFSVGFYGCNLRCPFCQNWEISQRADPSAPFYSPHALIDAARASGAPQIAFTYSEPLIHFEYLCEAAMLARNAHLGTVLVTNGYIEEEAAEELLPFIDAVNVDLKCFSAEAYAQKLGGDLETVCHFISRATTSSFVEVTTLVIPGLSDDVETIVDIARFLAGIDADIPLHLSAYHPAFQYKMPPTDAADLLFLAEHAARHLAHVYTGNIPTRSGRFSNTNCAACGALLVSRRGYRIDASGLAVQDIDKPIAYEPSQDRSTPYAYARCAACGAPSPIVIRRSPPQVR